MPLSPGGPDAAWFATLQSEQPRSGLKTAHITLKDAWDRELASWSLRGVWPAKYTGPQLNAGTNGVATEVLELVHHGFTVEVKG